MLTPPHEIGPVGSTLRSHSSSDQNVMKIVRESSQISHTALHKSRSSKSLLILLQNSKSPYGGKKRKDNNKT